MPNLYDLWKKEIPLTGEQIEQALNSFSLLPTCKKRPFIFVPFHILHQRRGHESYLSNLKRNFERLGLYDNIEKEELSKEDKYDTPLQREYKVDNDFVFFSLYKDNHFASAVLDKGEGVLNYYDSIEDLNSEEFNLLSDTLSDLGIIEKSKVKIHRVKFFQQDNSWECGYYVLISFWAAYMNGEAIDTKHISRSESSESPNYKKLKVAMEFMVKTLNFELKVDNKKESDKEGKKNNIQSEDPPSTPPTPPPESETNVETDVKKRRGIQIPPNIIQEDNIELSEDEEEKSDNQKVSKSLEETKRQKDEVAKPHVEESESENESTEGHKKKSNQRKRSTATKLPSKEKEKEKKKKTSKTVLEGEEPVKKGKKGE
jgi:hypothetical protein